MTVLIIASYSKQKILIYVAGCLLLCAALVRIASSHPAGGSLAMLHSDPGKFAFFWAGVTAGLIVACQQMVLLHQIFWRDGAAVWQSNGEIHYFDTYRLTLSAKIEIKTIEKVSAGAADFLG